MVPGRGTGQWGWEEHFLEGRKWDLVATEFHKQLLRLLPRGLG